MTNAISIFSVDAPAAIGPYSQAVSIDDTIYVSGQLPAQPGEAELVAGDISAQAEQVFANLRAILGEAGLTLAAAVKVTVFLTDLNDFAAVNKVYERHFAGGVLPARSTIQVAALPRGAAIEIELIAHRSSSLSASA